MATYFKDWTWYSTAGDEFVGRATFVSGDGVEYGVIFIGSSLENLVEQRDDWLQTQNGDDLT